MPGPLLTVLPFAAPWKDGPLPEDEPLVIVDGPDYPLAHLLRLARERGTRTAGRPKGARTYKLRPAAERCPAVCPNRDPHTYSIVAGKHRCTRPAGPGGYCAVHRRQLARAGEAQTQEGVPT